MIAPFLGKAAIAGAAWCGYSAVQYWTAASRTFRPMRFLCQQRPVGGNATLLQDQFDRLDTVKDHVADKYSACLSGHPIQDKDVASTKRLWTDKLVVKCSAKNNELSVYARPNEIDDSSSSIDHLVKEIPRTMTVMNNPFTFVVWMSAMARLYEQQQSLPVFSVLTAGTYLFSFRDYWNYEEEWQHMCERWCIQRFIWKPLRRPRLEFNVTGEAELHERSRLLGVIPFSIVWKGKVDSSNRRIAWDYSCMYLGYRRLKQFGLFKVIERPPAAEKLRKDPWTFYTDPNKNIVDWVVFERQGCGMLTFSRPS